MKNKGRKHIAGLESPYGGSANCKGGLMHVTRPIRSMSSKGHANGRFDKKKWTKRVRNYLKHLKYKQNEMSESSND